VGSDAVDHVFALRFRMCCKDLEIPSRYRTLHVRCAKYNYGQTLLVVGVEVTGGG